MRGEREISRSGEVIPGRIGHADIDGFRAIGGDGLHIHARNGQIPDTRAVCGGGVVFAVKGDSHGQVWIRGSADRNTQRRFCQIDDVITAGIHRHGQERRDGINRHIMRCRGDVLRHVIRGGSKGVITRRHRLNLSRRHREAPGAIGLHGGSKRRRIGFAGDNHGDRAAHRNVGGGTADGHPLIVLNDIDVVIAGNRVDGQRWQVARLSDHRGVVSGRRRVAAHIGTCRRHGHRSVRQGSQIRERNGSRPGAIRTHEGVVVITVKGHDHRLPFFKIRGGPGDRNIRAFFCRVNVIIARHGRDGQRWQISRRRIDAEAVIACGDVTGRIGDRR